MDFELVWEPEERAPVKKSKKQELDFWLPIEDPLMLKNEKRAFLYEKSLVDQLYVGLPAALYYKPDGTISFQPCLEIPHYYIIASLVKSPYLIFYRQLEKKNQEIDHILDKGGEIFFYDIYLSPHYGGYSPQFFFFEKMKLEPDPEVPHLLQIPEKMALFKPSI